MIPPARPFERVLVANRGEIALRIIRACHEMSMEAVAVYSDTDAQALYVRRADRAIRIGGAAPADSYLRAEAIIAAARQTGAQAIHPGYGFLAERASFAAAVEDAGIAFVGPNHRTIAALGDKLAARRAAEAAGVPVVPGTLEPAPVDRPDQVASIASAAAALGFPLMVKAAAGGGGRGMRWVSGPAELPAALAAGSSEAASAFGDGSVYLEREIRPARHIEVQLLGDATGRVVAIGERDCSIQRRHQKLIEEAPAPGLNEVQRRALHAMAIRLAVPAGLENAATAEFLYDRDGNFWFLEVNTRLQVEHGVTELVSGLDIVREQFWLASGAALSDAAMAASERAASPSSHAIEIRLSAEDPARQFAPSPGTVTRWTMPGGPGVRVDTAIEAGEQIPPDYDPLLAKVMVHAGDRPAAVARLRRALDELEVGGIQSTLPFDRYVVREQSFIEAELSTGWVGEHWDGVRDRGMAVERAIRAAGIAALADDRTVLPGGSGVPIAAGPLRAGAVVAAERRSAAGVRPGEERRPGGRWRTAGRVIGVDRRPT